MPITPIEMISIPNKSQEASHYKQGEMQKSFAEHTHIADKFSREVKQNSKQAVKTSKGDNKEYRYDAKEKGNGSNRQNGQKKKQGEQKNEASPNNEIKLSSFDIKI